MSIQDRPDIIDGAPSFNFISKKVDQEGKDLFFGPLGSEHFVVMDEHWTMANILVHAGIFPSLSQAKKQGANQEIPRGFSMVTRGKKKNKKNIFVLNI